MLPKFSILFVHSNNLSNFDDIKKVGFVKRGAIHLKKKIKTVLIIDDESYIREVISEVLNIWDIDSIEAEDGKTAIQLSREYKDKIDIVFLDLNLPQMSGAEIYEQISGIMAQDPLFVFISGFDKESIKDELPKTGKFLFLKKPFTINSIQEIIEQFSQN